jgi:hypothetical protein
MLPIGQHNRSLSNQAVISAKKTKKRITNSALITAITIATTMFHCPMFMLAAQTVATNRAMSNP